MTRKHCITVTHHCSESFDTWARLLANALLSLYLTTSVSYLTAVSYYIYLLRDLCSLSICNVNVFLLGEFPT